MTISDIGPSFKSHTRLLCPFYVDKFAEMPPKIIGVIDRPIVKILPAALTDFALVKHLLQEDLHGAASHILWAWFPKQTRP